MLVDYSDSESSENEKQNISKKLIALPKLTKKPFHKIIDKSNPGKIRLSLAQTSTEEENFCQHSSKKVKTGKETSGGFNSILPAPKRIISSSTDNSEGNFPSNSGLVSANNLINGSKPGFVRQLNNTQGVPTDQDTRETYMDGSSCRNLQPKLNIDEVKLKGKPLMFKPLSVSNKTTKKKKVISSSTQAKSLLAENSCVHKQIPEQLPKVSLFTFCTEKEEKKNLFPEESYKPLIYNTPENTKQVSCSGDSEVSHQDMTPAQTSLASNSLSTIAENLHLSDSERRRLFGRQMGKNGVTTATSIINFNTDLEYLHNEEVRASGEQVSHNPVRAIAPGKHSLKQLVNAAQSQKDALEESFAKGKNNRAEASSKYGW